MMKQYFNKNKVQLNHKKLRVRNLKYRIKIKMKIIN